MIQIRNALNILAIVVVLAVLVGFSSVLGSNSVTGSSIYAQFSPYSGSSVEFHRTFSSANIYCYYQPFNEDVRSIKFDTAAGCLTKQEWVDYAKMYCEHDCSESMGGDCSYQKLSNLQSCD